jgi:hypothetical protein
MRLQNVPYHYSAINIVIRNNELIQYASFLGRETKTAFLWAKLRRTKELQTDLSTILGDKGAIKIIPRHSREGGNPARCVCNAYKADSNSKRNA